MECRVHQDIILDDDTGHQNVKEAWEHEDDKGELKIDLQGLERQFWLGTEAIRLGCYDFQGETWTGDGSAYKGEMGAGSICLHRQDKCLVVRVGREGEGANSLWPELLAVARTLQATPPEVDILYLCDRETTLDKVSRWIGSGPRTTLAGDANADIMKTITECVRERVTRISRTFMVKVKAHRGEPLNDRADTQAERARQLPPECRPAHPECCTHGKTKA
jgi:ribonuclease HI